MGRAAPRPRTPCASRRRAPPSPARCRPWARSARSRAQRRRPRPPSRSGGGEVDLELALLDAADDGDGELLARRLVDGAMKQIDSVDLASTGAHDQIALGDSRAGGRAAAVNRANEDAIALGQP